MAIEFSRAAENDLLEIFRYGIEEHEIARAERYKARLSRCFQAISDNPKIMRLRRPKRKRRRGQDVEVSLPPR